MEKNTKIIIAAVLFISVITVVYNVWLGWSETNLTTEQTTEAVFSDNYNDLDFVVTDAYLTEDPDTGKIIANMDVELSNNADNAFRIDTLHFGYNQNESVLAFFSVDDYDVFSGKVKRGESRKGTVSVTLDMRDASELTSIEPVFSVYDMRTETKKEFSLDIPFE